MDDHGSQRDGPPEDVPPEQFQVPRSESPVAFPRFAACDSRSFDIRSAVWMRRWLAGVGMNLSRRLRMNDTESGRGFHCRRSREARRSAFRSANNKIHEAVSLTTYDPIRYVAAEEATRPIFVSSGFRINLHLRERDEAAGEQCFDLWQRGPHSLLVSDGFDDERQIRVEFQRAG